MPRKTKEDKAAVESIDDRVQKSALSTVSSASISSPKSTKLAKSAKLPVATPQKENIGGSERVLSVSSKKLLDDIDPKSPKKGAFGREPTAVLPIPTKVSKVYKLIHKSTGTLGGNGYDGAIYGELTMHSMQKIINTLVEKCELTSDSRFIDVGSGLGKPNFHVAQYPGVRVSVGIELETIRWKLAMHNLSHVLTAVSPEWTDLDGRIDTNSPLYGGVNFLCGDMDNAASTVIKTISYLFESIQ
jgi:Histone methylation protein DOT1